MASSELQQAWDAALATEDRSPWRVLADLLLSEGDARGEWLQLELDAEEGRLTGLARGRLPRLREELSPALLPDGVTPAGAALWRTVLIGAALVPWRATEAGDPRWRALRRLSFPPGPRRPSLTEWRSTPLGGPPLRWLETVEGLEEDALPLLAEGASFPALRRLWVRWPIGVPESQRSTAAQWSAWWDGVLARQPALREVHVGWAGPLSGSRAKLEALTSRPLERVGIESGPDELRELDDWARRQRFAGEFVVELRDLSLHRATVVVGGRDGLVLRCLPAVAAAARAQVTRSWRGRAYEPGVRVEPPLP